MRRFHRVREGKNCFGLFVPFESKSKSCKMAARDLDTFQRFFWRFILLSLENCLSQDVLTLCESFRQQSHMSGLGVSC